MAFTAKILCRPLVTVKPGATLSEAARIMSRSGVGSVLVCEGDRLAGIFTERDLLNRAVGRELDPARTRVEEVMTREVVTVDASAPLEKVFETLSRRRFRHLPITEGGKPVGIVSLTDFASLLSEVMKDERYLQYFASYLEDARSRPPSIIPRP